MDGQALVSFLGLIVGTSYLAVSLKTSFITDRPIHSSIILLAVCGLCIIGLERFGLFKVSRGVEKQYTSVPLEESHDRGISWERPQDICESPRVPALSSRRLRNTFIVLAIAICTRVVILDQILRDIQCTQRSYQPLIPFCLVLYNHWISRRHRLRIVNGDPSKSRYDAIVKTVNQSHYVVSITSLLFGLCSIVQLSLASPPVSTYICASTLPAFNVVPGLQCLGLFLDGCIAAQLSQLLDSGLEEEQSLAYNAPRVVGLTLLLSSAILTVAGLIISAIIFIRSPEHRQWLLTVPTFYPWSLTRLTVAVCFFAFFALRVAVRTGVVTTTVSIVFTCTYVLGFVSEWTKREPSPHFSDRLGLLSMVIMILSLVVLVIPAASSESGSRFFARHTFSRIPAWFYPCILILFLTRVMNWSSRSDQLSFHPIDMLLYESKSRHESWSKQASSSVSLRSAVQTYRARYMRNPPPHFNHWYEYATAHSSFVIDDYDNIHSDLLPFWSLSPAEIRQRTWEIIANPDCAAGGIHIRNGSVDLSANVLQTHRWMVEGVAHMIERFAKWLPDMDLAFNLNDEARVAVPFEELESMHSKAKDSSGTTYTGIARFSDNRASGWPHIPEEPITQTRFREYSFQRIFHKFGAVGCPPNSKARTEKFWNLKDLCTTCTDPHSRGQFISNWTLSASVCHQPDLADLHGFYLSPSAFRGTNELMPIFSQSKPHGFNDILYPSAWNYMDKVAYAPNAESPDLNFSQKQNSLFWRGVTSEGVAPGTGVWKGMARQRLVHLINNLTSSQPILAKTNGKLAYSVLSPSSLKSLLSTDVHLVDIARCGGQDCSDQATEFGPAYPRSDFQAHWQHRYLFDSDGAGFSGRFLPFLQSHSLPFKSALFREWYEGRLTAWRHFVPIDLRFHGLWSTLVYFAGVDEKEVKWEARVKEGEMIAEEGRRWVEKVLRKEDMEVYFFRLLIEWGRLTDDRRDELGFVE
ncbi:glycosyltransferase family 90 protein [Lepidopterella palustris CBS 459.81]|uniref:Glycosyltransferase family 90 protein n=1 Tax=Lepidopterella palustris CBS 459.81 TaxID=1314670 RepID=A0A8E2E8A7_9PEZI|nr:glycosyltransferase family 90 protein [Lepidopterella palustris CBS 459.81]